MSLPNIASILTAFIFGVAVIIISFKYEKAKEVIKAYEKEKSGKNGDFMHIIIHELRAPLTAIKDTSQLLLTNQNTLAQEEKNRLLSLIHQQSLKLIDQVGLILDAGRLKAGRFVLERKIVDVKRLIQETVDIFMSQAENKHVTLKANIDPTITDMYIDPTRFYQVLNNLISNSLKFTNEYGSIIVTAILNRSTPDNKPVSVTISVSDTGVGIPKEKQVFLFTQYSQLSSNQNGSSGTGLGLYITKGIVEAHGGKIQVDSEPNQGTTITFTLPIQPPPAQTNPTA